MNGEHPAVELTNAAFNKIVVDGSGGIGFVSHGDVMTVPDMPFADAATHTLRLGALAFILAGNTDERILERFSDALRDMRATV